MRSVACVTEEHEFFDCDQGFAEVFELDFPELCCGDHDFACSEGRMLAAPLGKTHDLSSRTHDLCSRTHDLSSRTHDLCSRMHDLGSCRLSESVLCRMQVAISQCLKVARHGLKVAQRVLHVLCPDLRAGFCQALRFHSAEASELYSGERCLFEHERSARFPSRRHLLPKLLFLILLVLWGYDGPYGGGCYAFGSFGFGCWNGGYRGWWNNNGFGRSMGAMGSYSPSHGSIGIPSSRCNSYSHGSIGNQQSRCTSYHHGSLGIPQSRCTSYHHGSIGIHSYGCTSYVSGSPFGYYAKRWPPAVAVPQIKYAARPGEGRLLDYASSLRLVSMSAPRFRGGPYGTTTTSSAAASSGGPTNLGGPISVPAWDQFSTASSSGLSPQEYAALNRMPMGSSEPEVREWPKFLRVRVSGDLNYTKVLTGNAAERSAGCIPLDYRPAPEVEAIPGPTVVGEKYLLVCERSLQLEREWAEAKLILEEEYPTPPSYVNARVVPMQSLQVASVQTEPEVPSTMEVGALTSDLELAHAKHSVMARIGTITLSTGIEVWMLQNFIRSLRGGMDALPKMHEARFLMECINMSQRYKETPQFRLETLSNRLVGEIEEGYSNYVALSNIPAQFTGSFVFQALYGDGQIRLRSSIRPSEPVRPRRQQPILAREGPVPGLEPPSGVVVTTMTGPETMSAPDNASETGPQRFIGLPMPPPREVGPLPSRDPGFPPPVEGLSLSEQIGRYLSLTSLLSEQMRWYTTRGLVVPEWCARHISLLHRKIHELQQSFHIQQTGVPP